MKATTKSFREDIYKKTTEAFINVLNAGIIPWQRPWNLANAPKNLISKKAYRGSNVWLLNAIAEFKGYTSKYWLTFKQAQDLKGSVKKGEKGTMIVYWEFRRFEKKDESTGEIKTQKVPFLKYSTVFNTDQCEGLEGKVPVEEKNEIGTIEDLEEVFANWVDRPQLSFGGDRACYIPALDAVKMPEKENFKTTAGYYCVLSHEYGHSTGAKNRLNRDGIVKFDLFGSHTYAKEELVAEMFASFMMGIAGLERETERNNKAYIQNWIEVLNNDPKMLISASSEAQKAVEYVLAGGNVPKEGEEETEENEVIEEREA